MLSNDVLLLKIVESQWRFSLLYDRGLSYSQIAELIKRQNDLGNLVVGEDYIKLTPCGRKVLEDNLGKIFTREKDQWVLPQEHRYRKPLSINEIVLPKGKKL